MVQSGPGLLVDICATLVSWPARTSLIVLRAVRPHSPMDLKLLVSPWQEEKGIEINP